MRFFCCLFLSAFLLPGLAQKTGEIHYNIKVNVHQMLTGDMERYKAYVPEFNDQPKKLIFNENYALYEKMDVEVKSLEDSHRSMGFLGNESDNKRFTDIKNRQQLSQLDAFGKTFLVSDTLKKNKWKITGKSKKIHDLPCISAEFSDSNDTYIAWFTPAIPVQLGPEGFGQLPGLILEMNNQDSSIVITTLNIDRRAVLDEEIKKPKKGKSVTKQEFDKIVSDKIKEFEERTGRKIPNNLRRF